MDKAYGVAQDCKTVAVSPRITLVSPEKNFKNASDSQNCGFSPTRLATSAVEEIKCGLGRGLANAESFISIIKDMYSDDI